MKNSTNDWLACLLRVLRNQQSQTEVVETQRHIEELVDVRKEDDVLDCVVGFFGMRTCRESEYWPSSNKEMHQTHA